MRIIIQCSDNDEGIASSEHDIDPLVAYALLCMLGCIEVPIETEAEKEAEGIINSMIECLEIWASWRG